MDIEKYKLGERILLNEHLFVMPQIFGGLALGVVGHEQKLNMSIQHIRLLLNFLAEYVPHEEDKFISIEIGNDDKVEIDETPKST